MLKERHGNALLNPPKLLPLWTIKHMTMKGDEIAGGNITDPQTRDVLRKKFKSEQLQGNLCTDVFQEVKILLETYRGIVDGFLFTDV